MSTHAKQDKRYTYADYKTWSEDERWEHLEGTPFNMSPAPTRTHQQLVLELARQIANFLSERECEGIRFPISSLLAGQAPWHRASQYLFALELWQDPRPVRS